MLARPIVRAQIAERVTKRMTELLVVGERHVCPSALSHQLEHLVCRSVFRLPINKIQAFGSDAPEQRAHESSPDWWPRSRCAQFSRITFQGCCNSAAFD